MRLRIAFGQSGRSTGKFELEGTRCHFHCRERDLFLREPARKVKTQEVVRNKSLIRLVVSLPGSMFHSLMPFNCFTVSFQNRWSGSRE